MNTSARKFFFVFGALTLSSVWAQPPAQRITSEGITVTFSMGHVDPARKGHGFRVGDDAYVRFHIADANQRPLSSLYPAGWMDPVAPGEQRIENLCVQKIQSFLSGSLFSRAEIDMNIYYVITLNQDNTLTVVDPLFGFGTTKLLALVELESPGEDWVLTDDQRYMFVSQPKVGKVAVVDTASWKVARQIEVGPYPTRLVMQKDERYLWVANDRHESLDSGVTVIDVRKGVVAGTVVTGKGYHRIALNGDGSMAFVTNSLDGTVSVIELAGFTKVRDLKTGSIPGSIAASETADALYVTHEGDGLLAVIDGRGSRVMNKIALSPGLAQVRVTPDGRLAFAINPERDHLAIVDTATNRVIQEGDVRDEPFQVNFSDTLAYISHRGSEVIYMLPLSEAVIEGKKLAVADFPGGNGPPGKTTRPSPAPGIVQAPGANAVLIANPGDEAVYFYKEGMAAPMGNFNNYGRQPRAVMVVDRSLKERNQQGVYETIIHLTKAGTYDVPFLLDAPRVVHCFQAEIAENPDQESDDPTDAIEVEPLLEGHVAQVGQRVPLAFRLTDKSTGQPITGLKDVRFLTNLTPGLWHKRWPAKDQGGGIYTVDDFSPPRAGVYYIYATSRTAQLPLTNYGYGVLRAIHPKPSANSSENQNPETEKNGKEGTP